MDRLVNWRFCQIRWCSCVKSAIVLPLFCPCLGVVCVVWFCFCFTPVHRLGVGFYYVFWCALSSRAPAWLVRFPGLVRQVGGLPFRRPLDASHLEVALVPVPVRVLGSRWRFLLGQLLRFRPC